MNKFNMFITAVCVLFLIKLRWPKNKSIVDVSCFFFKLTADQVLVFDWIAGSTQVHSPKHKRGFIFRALSVARRGYTAILTTSTDINYSFVWHVLNPETPEPPEPWKHRNHGNTGTKPPEPSKHRNESTGTHETAIKT